MRRHHHHTFKASGSFRRTKCLMFFNLVIYTASPFSPTTSTFMFATLSPWRCPSTPLRWHLSLCAAIPPTVFLVPPCAAPPLQCSAPHPRSPVPCPSASILPPLSSSTLAISRPSNLEVATSRQVGCLVGWFPPSHTRGSNLEVATVLGWLPPLATLRWQPRGSNL